MSKLKRIALLASLLIAPSFAAAEDSDILTDAVDPLVPGTERGRFLKAAGVDNELDEAEFKENAGKEGSFIRAFDSWGTLTGFDRNRNNTLDWFEADEYRRAVRTAVVAAYDKDKDGKITRWEAERVIDLPVPEAH